MEAKPAVSRDHIFYKARMTSEGVKIQGTQSSHPGALFDAIERLLPPSLEISSLDDLLRLGARSSLVAATSNYLGNCLVFDGSGLVSLIVPNPDSRLELVAEGDAVALRDGGEVLATGRVQRAGQGWGDLPLSNGLPARVVLPGMSEAIISLLMSLSCFNFNTRRGCRYCSLFANPLSRRLMKTPKRVVMELGRYIGEAVKIAWDHGWRGTLAVSGGALPPGEWSEYLERMALVMDPVREALGQEVFSSIRVVYNHYPPPAWSDMEKWKEMGITGTTMDLEVMDPAYFAAVCPGKNAYRPHSYWMEAQEVSVQVFGPLPHTTTRLVAGIEPMSCLLEGVEERLSKGILPVPLIFIPSPGSAYAGFRTPTAEWLLEAADRMASIYLQYAAPFLTAMVQDRSPCGPANAPAGPSDWSQLCGPNTLVFDEITRRLLEEGRPAVC